MSLFVNRRAPASAEKRGEFPWGPPSQYLMNSYSGIDPYRFETSLQSIAVRSSIDLLASLGSELPAHVYRGDGPDRKQISTPGNLEDPAGDGHGLQDWAYQALVSWLTRGNLYGDVLTRTASGALGNVLLLHPTEVAGTLSPDGYVDWAVLGKPISREKLLHRRANPVPGRVLGLSPIELAATQVGVSLSASGYGYDWYKSGAHPSALFTNSEEEIDEKKARTVKDRFLAALRGSQEPLVYGRGWEYKAIQVTAEESQFLATQGFSEAQCARIFGPGVAEILGYPTGGTMTYKNVESYFAYLLVATLNKWLRRLERLLSEFLPRPQYVKIDRDAILQTTTAERYGAHKQALDAFWKTINEIRADEELPPVDWGNEPYYNLRTYAESSAESKSESVSTTTDTTGG